MKNLTKWHWLGEYSHYLQMREWRFWWKCESGQNDKNLPAMANLANDRQRVGKNLIEALKEVPIVQWRSWRKWRIWQNDKYGENVPWVSRIFTLEGNPLKVARQQGACFQDKPEWMMASVHGCRFPIYNKSSRNFVHCVLVQAMCGGDPSFITLVSAIYLRVSVIRTTSGVLIPFDRQIQSSWYNRWLLLQKRGTVFPLLSWYRTLTYHQGLINCSVIFFFTLIRCDIDLPVQHEK